MNELVISIKSSSEVFRDFGIALKKARTGQIKKPHFEISFDNVKDFERFLKSIPLISAISANKPKSIYELAKIIKWDVSNLNKTIQFLDEIGAIRVKTHKINGRMVRTPLVDYKKIEFNLAA